MNSQDRYVVEPDIDHPSEFPKNKKGLEDAMCRALAISMSGEPQRIVKYENGTAEVIHYYEDGRRI